MRPIDLVRSDVMGCEWDHAPYLLFSQNVEPLVYYSHLLPALGGLAIILLIWSQGSRSFLNTLIVILALLFTSWSVFDLILWATDTPELQIFLWSTLIFINSLIYVTALCLIYVFIRQKAPPFRYSLVVAFLLLPVFLLAPTQFNLLGFDYTNCYRLAIEGPLWLYTYIIELVFVLWILVLAFRHIPNLTTEKRKQAVLLITGITLFLIAFSWGNLVGFFTAEWDVAQYGLFGLPVFLGFIIYLIVRFKSFDVRLFTTEALTISLWLLLLGLLFLDSMSTARPIILITLVLFGILGTKLILTARSELRQREELEQLTGSLKHMNERLTEVDRMKTEFVSIASHQMRSPLTAISGYASLILEGSYGPTSREIKDAVAKIFRSSKSMSVAVDDFLNVTRIEQGRIQLDKETFDLRELVHNTYDEYALVAQHRGLRLDLSIEPQEPVIVHADRNKIKQSLNNLIDNALKYTKEGWVKVALTCTTECATMAVSDSGIGIPKADQAQLFEKFTRAGNANSANVQGTGLGLYIVKHFVNMHKGSIWFESEDSKGTTFFISLPIGEGPPDSAHKPKVLDLLRESAPLPREAQGREDR